MNNTIGIRNQPYQLIYRSVLKQKGGVRLYIPAIDINVCNAFSSLMFLTTKTPAIPGSVPALSLGPRPQDNFIGIGWMSMASEGHPPWPGPGQSHT